MKRKILFVDLTESKPARDNIDVAVATVHCYFFSSDQAPKLKEKCHYNLAIVSIFSVEILLNNKWIHVTRK